MKKKLFLAVFISVLSCKTEPITKKQNVSKKQVFEVELNMNSNVKDQFKTTIWAQDSLKNTLVKSYTNTFHDKINQKFDTDNNFFPTKIILNLGDKEKVIKLNSITFRYRNKVLKYDTSKKLTDFFSEYKKVIKYDTVSQTLTIFKDEKVKLKSLLILKKKVLDSLR